MEGCFPETRQSEFAKTVCRTPWFFILWFKYLFWSPVQKLTLNISFCFVTGSFYSSRITPDERSKHGKNQMGMPEFMSPHSSRILYRMCQQQRLGFSLDIEAHSAETTNWWQANGRKWSWQQNTKKQGRQSLTDAKGWTWGGVKVMQVRRITCG